MDEQLEFLIEIVGRLEAAEIAYMVTGSMALSVYGTPRMTRDIDFVVELSPGDAGRFAALFADDCFVSLDAVSEAVEEQGMFNIIHNERVIKADFVVRKRDPYRRTEFARRRSLVIAGTDIWFVAPEDLILSKLCWLEISPSEQQERDVRALLRSVDSLDRDYLAKWAAELDVDEPLRRLEER